MAALVIFLILSVIGAVFNEPLSYENEDNEIQYDGPFAGLADAFTGNEQATRGFFNFFGSQNKSCSFANSFGFGNASCSLSCLLSGFQQGGICQANGFCLCTTA